MDYSNWEYLADNISAWKQELSSSPPKGELALKETSGEKRRKRKESSPSNVHPIDDFVLPAKAATATASHASDCTSTPEDAHLSTRWVLPP